MVTFLIGVLFSLTQSTANELPAFTLDSTSNTSQPSAIILIAGNGPERYLLEILAQAFEQRHPSIAVDFFWHPTAKPIRRIELGEADIAVTGEKVPSLRSTMIARDGIAVESSANIANSVAAL